MSDTADMAELQSVRDTATLLFDGAAVRAAIARQAALVTRDYRDRNPILITVMNGGLIVAGQLLPLLDFPLEVDYCHATRYRGETSGSDLVWKAQPQSELAGRDVLIVDDILDEGHTLLALIEHFESLGARSVKTLVLIEKCHDRKAIPGMTPDYCGLQAPDEYLFGFGMDYRHYWRNSDGIYYINE